MPAIQMTRKGLLPIAKMRVELAGDIYEIAGLASQQIDLQEGDYEIKMRLEGWYATKSIEIGAQTTRLIIKPMISDWYYLVALICCVGFFTLDQAGMVTKIVLGAVGGVMILSIMYFTFFRDQKYFDCTVE